MRFFRPYLDRVAHLRDIDPMRFDRGIGERAGDLGIAAAEYKIAAEPARRRTDHEGNDGGSCELAAETSRPHGNAAGLQSLGYFFLRHLPPSVADHRGLRAPGGDAARRVGMGREIFLDRT